MTVARKTKDVCASTSLAVIETKASLVSHIANIVTEETTCGSLECPWLLKTPPGQKIKLILHDFAVSSRSSSDFVDDSPRICHVYAVIKGTTDQTDETICASNSRSQWVYSTVTNATKIWIVAQNTSAYFVLQYEGRLNFVFMNCDLL